ncbi:ABC transporter [Zalerion maritima]|uniref:ABC transporter n=1 Tax=Zalerion maritima TaxID=339359 RepID=A0AAD5RJU5_9PEZI|nr:ABC transporter [Zalerion maritima]
MTSMADESVATIQVAARQTRFNIQKPDYRELDVQDLDIRILSGEKVAKGSKGKAKAANGEGNRAELLAGANLKLQGGQRYALLGRNGCGKSTLLKAIAYKLIPDIPEETRITALQQTDAKEVSSSGTQNLSADGVDRTVLEEVIERATAKDAAEHEITELSSGASDTDTFGTVRAYRRVVHERRQKKLFLLDKQARLRSGARGLQARKDLRAFEKEVAESQKWVDQGNEEITSVAVQEETEEAMNMLADLQIQVEPTRIAEIESQAKKTLTGLGFSESDMKRKVSTLSGGWTMRTALAAALLEETDILILDEPTNYLDLLGIMWLQNHLQCLDEQDSPPTLLLVSHDRAFITKATTDLILVKEKNLTYFHGSLQSYEEGQAEKRIYMMRMREAQDKQKAHIQDTITRSRQQGKATGDDNKLRQAKTRQKKLDERWGLQVSAKGGRFKLNRDLAGYHLTMRADIEVDSGERPVSFVLPEPPDLRFPGALINLEKAAFKYPMNNGDKTGPTLEAISLTVHEGDRIGILGLNGAGKSTLIRLLVGQTRPTSGTVTLHPRVRLGYYSQGAVESLQSLTSTEGDRDLTPLALLSRDIGSELDEGEVRGLLGSLGLPGRLASDIPIRKLSGGQLVRCALARILWKRPQVLVLDEVTTHLDYETVGAMRGALRDWPGAVALVSHDRWFVRGVVEGERDEGEEDEEEDEEDDGQGVGRRRVVYRLFKGGLTPLQNGVDEFEGLMERKVKRMAAV